MLDYQIPKFSDKQKAIVCDLDGTLCDITHRRHLVTGPEKKDHKTFQDMLVHDTPNSLIGQFLNFSRFRGYKIIFVSGRNEDARQATQRWLSEYFPGFEKFCLFMRAVGDYRPDFEVKREIYQRDIEPGHEVSLVLDDRSSVVNEWRRLGLQCWQVAEGNY